MFLENYKPRHQKVINNKILGYLKYILILVFLITIFIIFIYSRPVKNESSYQEDFFIGTYEKSKNIVKIENATFVGKDNKKQPYTITAELAIKESSKKNLFTLKFLEADISLNEDDWFILKTKRAIFDISKKTLYSNNEVEAFYDDGTSFLSSILSYNFNNGILSGKEGVVMSGKWGKIISKNFTYNSNKNILTFEENPIMLIN